MARRNGLKEWLKGMATTKNLKKFKKKKSKANVKKKLENEMTK